MEEKSIYDQRGVSSQKEEVHAAIKKLDKGLFPGAFTKVSKDLFRPGYVKTMHADGAGTKAVLAYLYWKHTHDLSVWKGIAQDAFVMNLDDVLCTGFTEAMEVTMSIDRNQKLITGEVLSTLIAKVQQLCDWVTSFDIPCEFCGGETADVGNAVRTITVNNTFRASAAKIDIIDASNISAPAFIVGFSSDGQASWEDMLNSGIMANGLTSAQHDALAPNYRKYTETYSPEIDPSLIFCGKHQLYDALPGDYRFDIATALLSPTRSYLPLLLELFRRIGREYILGLIHCSGGGQTKIGKFGRPGITYCKDALPKIPAVFAYLKQAGKQSWKEFYQVYNAGIGMEAVVRNRTVAQECIAVAKSFGINAWITGEVIENEQRPNGRTVIIKNGIETLQYDFS